MRAPTALIAFFLVAFPFSAVASSPVCLTCPPTPDQELRKNIDPILMAVKPPKLQWFAADATLVNQAPCRPQKPPSEEQLRAELNSLIPPSDRKISKRVHGFDIRDESEFLVNLLEKLTTYEDWDTERKAKNQKTFESSCQKVRCAVDFIFGANEGTRLLYMLARYGFNGSHHAFPEADAWRASELDDVLMALGDWPPSVLPISENTKLTHYPRDSSKGKTLANATIGFFSSWSSMPEAGKRQMIVFHEIAHRIGGRHRLDESELWRSLSEWEYYVARKDGKDVTYLRLGKPSAVPSEYGQTNPFEDFAESVVAYRYNPSVLLSGSPEKYQLLKEAVFDGLEYTSEEACAPKHSFSKRLEKELTAIAFAKASQPDNVSVATIIRSCAPDIFKMTRENGVLDSDTFSAVEHCAYVALTKDSIPTSNAASDLKYPELASQSYLANKPNPNRPPLALSALYPKVSETLREKLSAIMVRFFHDRRHALALQKFEKNRKSRDEFCKSAAEFAYQSADASGSMEFFSGGDPHFGYYQSDFFQFFSSAVCNRVLAEIPDENQPAKEKIDQAVATLIR